MGDTDGDTGSNVQSGDPPKKHEAKGSPDGAKAGPQDTKSNSEEKNTSSPASSEKRRSSSESEDKETATEIKPSNESSQPDEKTPSAMNKAVDRKLARVDLKTSDVFSIRQLTKSAEALKVHTEADEEDVDDVYMAIGDCNVDVGDYVDEFDGVSPLAIKGRLAVMGTFLSRKDHVHKMGFLPSEWKRRVLNMEGPYLGFAESEGDTYEGLIELTPNTTVQRVAIGDSVDDSGPSAPTRMRRAQEAGLRTVPNTPELRSLKLFKLTHCGPFAHTHYFAVRGKEVLRGWMDDIMANVNEMKLRVENAPKVSLSVSGGGGLLENTLTVSVEAFGIRSSPGPSTPTSRFHSSSTNTPMASPSSRGLFGPVTPIDGLGPDEVWSRLCSSIEDVRFAAMGGPLKKMGTNAKNWKLNYTTLDLWTLRCFAETLDEIKVEYELTKDTRCSWHVGGIAGEGEVPTFLPVMLSCIRITNCVAKKGTRKQPSAPQVLYLCAPTHLDACSWLYSLTSNILALRRVLKLPPLPPSNVL